MRIPCRATATASRSHRELLQVGGKSFQVLIVGQHRDRLRAEKIVVPDREQTHQHRQIMLERRDAEMLVHLIEAGQHRLEVVRTGRDHGGKTDRGIHRVAPADPIPETEHVRGVDAELADLVDVS